MDQDRQGFVEFVEHVHPMRSVYTQIAKTGRGLYTKLNMERGKHFNDLCKNMQGVLNMIAQGKIKVNKEESELSGLRRYDRDLCRALKNRRKFRERVKSMKTGPQMSRSIAKLANKALAHREELKEQGRWKPFLEGQDLRHIPVKVKSSPGAGAGAGASPLPSRTIKLWTTRSPWRTVQRSRRQHHGREGYVSRPQTVNALDQFYIKRLGLRIKELVERVQTEQAAPKSVTLKESTLREGVAEALEDPAQNYTLNLVPQHRPRKKAGRPPPKQEKEQQQYEWEEQEEEETPKGTGKQQRKKGRKLKYTQAPPQFQFSYRPRRGTPIAHPTRNRQRSRTGTGVSGGGILRLPWLE